MIASGPPLPDDWEAQIIRAYTTFGWFSRLRRKDSGPGEWTPELHPRGQEGAPGGIGGQFVRKPTGVYLPVQPPDPEPLPAIARPRPAPGPKARPEPPPRDPDIPAAERLEGEEAVKRLIEAGYSPSEAKHWTDRGIVYQHPTEPGRNPVFGFAAAPDAEVESSLAADHLRTTSARDLLGIAEIELRDATRNGSDPAYIARLERQADKARRAMIEAHNTTVGHEDAARERFGSGGKEQIGEYHDRAAEDVTDHVAKQLAKMPAAVDEDGKPVPFMVQFDGSEIAGDQLGTTLMDGTTISINLDRYFDPMPEDDGHFFRTGEKYLGRYVAGHEVGHALDHDDRSNPDASDANIDLWESVTDGLSGYGRTNHHEGYAEMFALWLAHPDDPRVQGYAERFGWGERQRRAKRTSRDAKRSQTQYDYSYRVRDGRSVYDDMNGSGALPKLTEEG